MTREEMQELRQLIQEETRAVVSEIVGPMQQEQQAMRQEIQELMREQLRQGVLMETLEGKVKLAYDGIVSLQNQMDVVESIGLDVNNLKNRVFALEEASRRHSAQIRDLQRAE